MLSLPAHSRIGDVTVYQDDAVWHRFYPVASRPRLRLDGAGQPVFLLATYSFTEQDRTADPNLPVGGGYLSFDTELRVDPDAEAAIREELQDWVDAEHVRRNPGADPGTPPAVEISEPLVSGGVVTMLAPQSEALVSGRFAESPASTASGSTAVFSLDLTAAGAAFMHGLLVDPTGAGQSDLTPIQVQYELTMWARLPPVSIEVTANSKRIHTTLQTISESNADNLCTPAEIESYKENGTNSSTLSETGLVDVKIDAGDAQLPEDAIRALQDYALSLFDTMVKERFLVPASADDGALEFESDDPQLHGRDDGWAAVVYRDQNYGGEALELTESISSLGGLNNNVSSVRVRGGAKVRLYSGTGFSGTSRLLTASTASLGAFNDQADAARVWFPPTTRYKVRESINEATMDLTIRVERSSVVEWPLSGMATMETFFAGASPEELGRHVVHVHADMLQSLGVDVRAFAPFGDGFDAVEVHLEYVVPDDDGEPRVIDTKSVVVESSDQRARFDPPVVGEHREYRYRYRVIRDDGSSGEFTEWTPTTTRGLNITVADPARAHVEISAAALDFGIVHSVDVDVRWTDPLDVLDDVSHTALLTTDHRVALWSHRFDREVTGDVDVHVSYRLADDKVVERPVERVPITQNLFVIPPPHVDVLDVTFLPSGDWTDVARVVVTARYEAGGGRIFDWTHAFASIEEIATWRVLLADSTQRAFSYQITATYRAGTPPHQTDWIAAEGDQTIVVDAFAPPRLRVNVHPTLIDFERTPAVTVAFSYAEERRTISLLPGTIGRFDAPLLASGSRDYEYEITYHTLDGDPITSGPFVGADTELMIPRAHLPTTGKLIVSVRAAAVDWDTTPFVDVELWWTDGEVEQRHHATLTVDRMFTEWQLDIGDRSIRTYSYRITYSLPSGELVPGPQGESDKPMLSITPLVT